MDPLEPWIGRIHRTDCIELMPRLPAESVDLIVADGPYGLGAKAWDRVGPSIQEYNLELLRHFARLLRPGGAAYLFGKHDCIDFVDYRPYLDLRSRIVWYQPSRLSQGRISYTNNYDVICYFTKGRPRVFNLDDIRVPHLVELEHRKRCENVPSVRDGRYGRTRFNASGKNPGDVWGDIKQLTYRSRELADRSALNTVQKPEKLIERIVLASSCPGDVVFDPFSGTGTTAVVCHRLSRRFFGCEISEEMHSLASARVRAGDQ